MLSTTLREWVWALRAASTVVVDGTRAPSVAAVSGTRVPSTGHASGTKAPSAEEEGEEFEKSLRVKEVKFRSPASVLGTTEATKPSSAHKEMPSLVGTPIGRQTGLNISLSSYSPQQLSTAGVFLRFATSTSFRQPRTSQG